MRVSRLASAAAVAVMLAAAPVLVSASDSATDNAVSKPVSAVSSQAVPASPLATLKGVKAAPMSSSELDAVKGQDAHFVTINSNNQLFGMTGLHVVVRNNRDHWLDLGNGILVAPGYHGLCGAALNSPNMVIPGQNETTGGGGGC